MIQVLFGTIASYDDLGLMLTDVDIGLPEPKRTLVEIPGKDGYIDMTYVLNSDITYKNRTINLEFAMADYNRRWSAIFSEIAGSIHGKKMHVIIGDDPDYYWDAFVKVSKVKNEGNAGDIHVTLDAFPYKIRTEDTAYVTVPTSAGVAQKCRVRGRKVIPMFTASASGSTITVAGSSSSITHFLTEGGTHTFDDIVFKEGDHDVLVKGTSGTVTIEYREMIL